MGVKVDNHPANKAALQPLENIQLADLDHISTFVKDMSTEDLKNLIIKLPNGESKEALLKYYLDNFY